MKLMSDSYLYRSADYNREIFNYLMSAERIDKNSEGFADVIYDVKRQTNSTLMKVLLSDKVVLLMAAPQGVSRAFKVIYAKDIKEKKDKKKVFIDCTGIITPGENGIYKCNKVGTLISYIFTAMVYVLYYNAPKTILANATIMKSGTEAFVDLMLYTLGYLKVPVTYADNKERMSFVIAEYFQLCVAGRDANDGVLNLAKSISKIEDRKTCDYLHAVFGPCFDDGKATFDIFLDKFSEVFLGQNDSTMPKNRAKLTVDAFAQRWMWVFGPNTFLGLECFVPFSQMLTDCYMGSFINQQNTIEKVVGKNIVTFSNELLKVGSENS